MYSIVNETAYISGDFGKYDNKVKNNSARYGRNSVDNFKLYLYNYTQPQVDIGYQPIDFSNKSRFGFINKIAGFFKNLKFNKQINKLMNGFKKLQECETKRSPLEFVQKYMPGRIENGKIDKTALMAAAYEEMGTVETSLEELNAKAYQFEGVDEDLQISSDALDINQDGKVDIAEYSTSILLEDALSSDTDELKHENINGVITKGGSNKSLAYYAKRNTDTARNVFAQIYEYYNLDKAKQEFIQDKNNIA